MCEKGKYQLPVQVPVLPEEMQGKKDGKTQDDVIPVVVGFLGVIHKVLEVVETILDNNDHVEF
jgi:hypothetical protein